MAIGNFFSSQYSFHSWNMHSYSFSNFQQSRALSWNQYRCGNDFISMLVVVFVVVGSGFFPYISAILYRNGISSPHVYLMRRWWSPLHARRADSARLYLSFFFSFFQFRDRCYGSNTRARSNRTRRRRYPSSRRASTEWTSGRSSARARTSKDRSRSPGTMSPEIFRLSARPRLARGPTTTVSNHLAVRFLLLLGSKMYFQPHVRMYLWYFNYAWESEGKSNKGSYILKSIISCQVWHDMKL